MPASTATPSTESVTRPSAVVAVLAFAGIVSALTQTMIIPLVSQLPSLLHTSAANASWVITSTLLAGAVATPVMGRLGDMYGKRRMLLVSLALLVAGSVVAALSGSLAPMVIGRVLQGLSAGVIPLGISIMRDELPKERLSSATATMSSSLGVGGALGLPLAAFTAERANWHVLFWVSAALGALALALVASTVPESSVRTGGRFDFFGAVTLSIALISLLLAVSKGSDWGWTDLTTVVALVIAAVSLGVWAWWELRCRQPLVDLRVSAGRQVLLTNLAAAVFAFGMFAMSLVLPQLLQLPTASGFGLGQSLIVVGLVMAPSGIVMMLVAPISSRLTIAKGPKVTLMAGALVVAAGYLFAIVAMSELWQLIVVSAIIGAGIGLGYGAMPSLIMAAVPISESAAANSLNTLMRAIGTAVASAVVAVILSHMTFELGAATLPTQNAFRVVLGLGAAAALAACALASLLSARDSSLGPQLPSARPQSRASRTQR